MRNFHITNKEVGNKIIFLRKLEPGGSTHSFGIHVAKMAGMPPALINRANDILKQLEESREVKEDEALSKPANQDLQQSVKSISAPQMQLSIFDAHTETFDEIRKLLEQTDINRLTPVEALLKLDQIKKLLH